jgi:hypothetical protein
MAIKNKFFSWSIIRENPSNPWLKTGLTSPPGKAIILGFVLNRKNDTDSHGKAV